MNWVKLTDLPGSEYKSGLYDTTYWSIKDGKVLHQGRVLRGADASSFEVRVEKNSSQTTTGYDEQVFFGRDSCHIYHAWEKMKQIDRDSFEEVGNNYWKDENLIYCEFETSIKPLKGRDAKSFLNLTAGYARDSLFAYYFGRPIKSCCDPMSLKLADSSQPYYASDSENVYFEGAVLKGSDPQSWRFISDFFSADYKSVYFYSRKLPRVDVGTWEPLSNCFSRDKNSVFYMNEKLKGADSNSWILFGGSYSKDCKNMYFGSVLLEGIDAETFAVLPDVEARALLVRHTERLFKRALSDDELAALNNVTLK